MNVAKRILLVDDEPLIIKGLRFTLEQEGYEILTASDGEEALEVFHSEPVDLVLLDVMLPKLDGIQVCQRIRETSNVPILMLTAKGEDMDKILGLEYGADDYMTKPFNILEVKARIKTVLRRVSQPVTNEEKKIIRVHDMEVNIVNRSVTLGGKEVRLTAKEFDLLQLFINNRGKVFSRETMLEKYRGILRLYARQTVHGGNKKAAGAACMGADGAVHQSGCRSRRILYGQGLQIPD